MKNMKAASEIIKVIIENKAPKLSLTSPNQIPKKIQIKTWCAHVLTNLNSLNNLKKSSEIYIGFINIKTIHDLNLTYRHKDRPTNVLSFPFELPPGLSQLDPLDQLNQPNQLGDILICPEVILKESQEQNKLFQDHLAHMVIHGTLHLLGYDHENDSEAEIMEALEIKFLNYFNIPNPY